MNLKVLLHCARAVSPPSLQILRTSKGRMIDDVITHMTSFVQKYSLTPIDVSYSSYLVAQICIYRVEVQKTGDYGGALTVLLIVNVHDQPRSQSLSSLPLLSLRKDPVSGCLPKAERFTKRVRGGAAL